MSKKKKKNNKTKHSVDRFVLIMTIALVGLLVLWVIKDNKQMSDDKKVEQTYESTTKDFTKIGINSGIELISSEKLSFIYIGYEGCSACESFVPRLAEVAKDYDMEVYYINFKEIDRDKSNWKDFTNKFTIKQKINIQEDDNAVSSEKTIGEYLYNEGYTPTIAIFKSNKMVDGHIGKLTRSEIREMLNNAGFKENS